MDLQPLVQRIDEKRYGDALAAAVDLWRTQPSALLADLVDRFDQPGLGRSELTVASHDEWLSHAARLDARDVGVLLADVGEVLLGEAVARVRVLDGWPADPREARKLCQLVVEEPFPQSSLNWLWPLVFRRLSAIGDMRPPPAGPPSGPARLDGYAPRFPSRHRCPRQRCRLPRDRRSRRPPRQSARSCFHRSRTGGGRPARAWWFLAVSGACVHGDLSGPAAPGFSADRRARPAPRSPRPVPPARPPSGAP